MPFVVWYIGIILAFAGLSWVLEDRPRAKGLLAIALILPVAFLSYNHLTPPAGNHAMTLLWLVAPVALYFQGLVRILPAILGEFIAIPYLLASFHLLDGAAALWWGDFIGLTMIALIAGPLIGRMVGMGVAWASLLLGGGHLAVGPRRDPAE